MAVRGVRGATTTIIDQKIEVLEATHELLKTILETNPTMLMEDIASCFFTVTDDLESAFPAEAARKMGWRTVPLMCAREIGVTGGLQRCIRVLIHWNTDLPQEKIQHVYLRDARSLRLDINQEKKSC